MNFAPGRDVLDIKTFAGYEDAQEAFHLKT
jgi:hypothetical protein